MRQIIISRPTEIVAGSGVALMATVATMKTPQIVSVISMAVTASFHTGTISSIIGLVVV